MVALTQAQENAAALYGYKHWCMTYRDGVPYAVLGRNGESVRDDVILSTQQPATYWVAVLENIKRGRPSHEGVNQFHRPDPYGDV